MALTFDAPENFDQDGNGLREPGKYHCVVLAVDENPTNKDGKLIDNAVFRASLAVLDGTTAGQQSKQFDLLFFSPKLTDRDRGEMAKKKIWFFANAIGCGEIRDGRMVLDFAAAAGHQVCLDIEMRESERDGKKYHNPSLVYCNVYHIDDPRVKDWPKDTAAMSLLPASQRKKPEDFPKAGKATTPAASGNGGGSGNGSGKQAAATPPAATAGAAGNVNLDDL